MEKMTWVFQFSKINYFCFLFLCCKDILFDIWLALKWQLFFVNGTHFQTIFSLLCWSWVVLWNLMIEGNKSWESFTQKLDNTHFLLDFDSWDISTCVMAFSIHLINFLLKHKKMTQISREMYYFFLGMFVYFFGACQFPLSKEWLMNYFYRCLMNFSQDASHLILLGNICLWNVSPFSPPTFKTQNWRHSTTIQFNFSSIVLIMASYAFKAYFLL